MAGKHTPAPWRWDGKPGESDLRHEGEPGESDGCVLRHEAYEGIWFSAYGQPGANEANARLIAAAPDLLEALQNMLGAFDTPARRLKFPYSFGDEAIETALAAIARATQPLPPQSEEV